MSYQRLGLMSKAADSLELNFLTGRELDRFGACYRLTRRDGETDTDYRDRLATIVILMETPAVPESRPVEDLSALKNDEFARAFRQGAGLEPPVDAAEVERAKTKARLLAAAQTGIQTRTRPQQPRRLCDYCGAWLSESALRCGECKELAGLPTSTGTTGRTYESVKALCKQAMEQWGRGASGIEHIYFVHNEQARADVTRLIKTNWISWVAEKRGEGWSRLPGEIHNLDNVFRYLIDVCVEDRAERILRGRKAVYRFDHACKRHCD